MRASDGSVADSSVALPRLDFAAYVAERTADFSSRDWVLGELDDWLEDSDGERFFLILGEPGSGKTVLAARVMEIVWGQVAAPSGSHVLGQGAVHAWHFCSARERRWIEPQTFSASLALQLANADERFAISLAEIASDRTIRIDISMKIGTARSVRGLVIENLHAGGATPEEAFSRLVREPLEAVLMEVPDRRIVILVDAVDETLAYRGGAGIIDLLADAEALMPSVRFILTSRPGSVRRRLGDNMRICDLAAAGHVQRSREDVERFVSGWLHNRADVVSRLELGLARRDVEQLIAKRSSGNFLYAREALNVIATGQGTVRVRDLDDLPAGLDAIYVRALDRLVASSPRSWTELYRPIAGILAVARATMPERVIAELSGISRQETRDALGALRQFLVADDQRGYRFYHQSFADFLLSEDRAAEYWCDAARYHGWIVDHYKAGRRWDEIDWSSVDDYGLAHVAAHARAAGRARDAFELLSAPVMRERRRRDGSDAAFALDVRAARDEARSASGHAVAEELRAEVVLASLRSRSSEAALDSLLALSRSGRRREALASAVLIVAPDAKLQAYCALAAGDVQLGRLAEARETIQRALNAASPMLPALGTVAIQVGRLAGLLVRVGDVASAQELVLGLPQHQFRADAYAELAIAFAELKAPERAADAADEAAALAEGIHGAGVQRAYAAVSAARAQLAAGRLRRAAGFARNAASVGQGVAYGQASEAVALAAACLARAGEPQQAGSILEAMRGSHTYWSQDVIRGGGEAVRALPPGKMRERAFEIFASAAKAFDKRWTLGRATRALIIGLAEPGPSLGADLGERIADAADNADGPTNSASALAALGELLERPDVVERAATRAELIEDTTARGKVLAETAAAFAALGVHSRAIQLAEASIDMQQGIGGEPHEVLAKGALIDALARLRQHEKLACGAAAALWPDALVLESPYLRVRALAVLLPARLKGASLRRLRSGYVDQLFAALEDLASDVAYDPYDPATNTAPSVFAEACSEAAAALARAGLRDHARVIAQRGSDAVRFYGGAEAWKGELLLRVTAGLSAGGLHDRADETLREALSMLGDLSPIDDDSKLPPPGEDVSRTSFTESWLGERQLKVAETFAVMGNLRAAAELARCATAQIRAVQPGSVRVGAVARAARVATLIGADQEATTLVFEATALASEMTRRQLFGVIEVGAPAIALWEGGAAAVSLLGIIDDVRTWSKLPQLPRTTRAR